MHYLNKYWFKKGGLSLLSRVSEFLLGFLVFMMMTRLYTKELFGVWVLFSTYTILIEIVRTNFVQNSFVKFFVSAESYEKNRVFTSALILNITITLISIGIFYAASGFSSVFFKMPQLDSMLKLYCLVMFFSIPFTQFVLLMQARYDFKGIFISQVFRILVFFGFILFHFISGEAPLLKNLVITQLVTALFASLLSFLLTREKSTLKLEFDKGITFKMFSFSKYLMGTSLVSMLSNSIDKFIMGYFLGSSSLASFNAASRITNTADIPFVAISAVVYPKGSEKLKNEGLKSLKTFYEQSAGLVLSAVIPFALAVFLFSDSIILITAGKEFADAGWILKYLVLASLLKPFDRQSGVFLDMIGKPELNMYTVFISFIFTSFVYLLLISTFGTAGAVAGTIISLTGSIILTHIILYKKIKINPFKAFIYAAHNYYHLSVKAVNIFKIKILSLKYE